MNPEILALDKAGAPREWLSLEDAARYYAKGQVAWSAGSTEFTLHGGTRKCGSQSVLRVNSVIAITGRDFMVRNLDRPRALNKEMLFARDRHICAYCALKFRSSQLTLEHILPQSKGGENSWMNVVAACKACNNRKADRTPEQAGMRLVYVPYEPHPWEAVALKGRRVLADQMEWLLAGIPKHSRLHLS